MAATFHELTSKEFASLGFWAIPMFSILFLAFLPVWVVGLTTLRNLKTQVLFLKYKKSTEKIIVALFSQVDQCKTLVALRF